jgi:tetratricopeptide (TPR) repeat protein
MARHDWFTNKDWNHEIESAFFTKLGRAKHKAHYLRIQAGILANNYPETALRLLDAYFAMGDQLDRAQAHMERATAFLALGKLEHAIQEYESALTVEATRPNFRTQAIFDLPLLIAERKDQAPYGRALDILRQSASNAVWHFDRFRWQAAQALIRRALGKLSEAREHARAALEAASHANSGLRYHPTVGVVGERYDPVRRELVDIVELSGSRRVIESVWSLFVRPRPH